MGLPQLRHLVALCRPLTSSMSLRVTALKSVRVRASRMRLIALIVVLQCVPAAIVRGQFTESIAARKPVLSTMTTIPSAEWSPDSVRAHEMLRSSRDQTRGARTKRYALIGALIGAVTMASVTAIDVSDCDACMFGSLFVAGAGVAGLVAGGIVGAAVGYFTFREETVHRSR